MQAACFVRPGVLELRELPEPTVQTAHDVIVEVEVTGLCGTDLHIVSVPQLHPATEGVVLGHELVGTVAAIGSEVRRFREGDRVIAGPNIPCAQCGACQAGRRSMCSHNTTLGITAHGGLARFVKVPAHCLYPVPDGLAAEAAVFAEPLSCVMNGLQLLSAYRRERVVVLGAGPIGLYFLRVLRHFGALDLISAEPIEARRAAAARSGATDTLDPRTEDVVRHVLERTHGGADVVVDTTGHLIVDALAMIRAGGVVMVFGMDATCRAPVPVFDLVRHQKAVLGCFVNNDLIPVSLELIPRLGVPELVTHRFPLSRIDSALATLRDGRTIKTLVDLR